jgi:hypothetical protein
MKTRLLSGFQNGAKRHRHCVAGKVSGQLPAQQSRLLPAANVVGLRPASAGPIN